MLLITLWLFILKINASRIESACVSYCIWIETREKEELEHSKKTVPTLTIIHLQIDTKKNLGFSPIIQVLSPIYTDGVRQRLPQICVSCGHCWRYVCNPRRYVTYVSVWVMVLRCHGIMIKSWQMLRSLGKCCIFPSRKIFNFLVMWSKNYPAVKNVTSAMENVTIVNWWLNFKTITQRQT